LPFTATFTYFTIITLLELLVSIEFRHKKTSLFLGGWFRNLFSFFVTYQTEHSKSPLTLSLLDNINNMDDLFFKKFISVFSLRLFIQCKYSILDKIKLQAFFSKNLKYFIFFVLHKISAKMLSLLYLKKTHHASKFYNCQDK
jgi:hypothetical protein